jgi:hypothetical protein
MTFATQELHICVNGRVLHKSLFIRGKDLRKI